MAKKIMIVDDSRMIRSLVSLTLEGANYEVCTAEDGRDALNKVEDFAPNLIICDVNMPHIGGLDFVKTIKKTSDYDSLRFTPVVMLTTESSDEMRSEGKRVGATAWMVKPFVPERLLEVVEKMVGQAVLEAVA